MTLLEELALVEHRAGWPWEEAWELAKIDLTPWKPEEDEVDLGTLGGPPEGSPDACTFVPAK